MAVPKDGNEVNSKAITVASTVNTDNEYNVIVEVKQADGTYKVVESKVVKLLTNKKYH